MGKGCPLLDPDDQNCDPDDQACQRYIAGGIIILIEDMPLICDGTGENSLTNINQQHNKSAFNTVRIFK